MKSIAETLAQGPAPAVDPVSPYLPNIPLEQQTAPANVPVNPLLLAIAHRLGLMNLIRNRSNQQVAATQEVLQ